MSSPVLTLLGVALSIPEWIALGWVAPLALTVALLLRRFLAVWAVRPLFRGLAGRSETLFLSWFGAVGVSALFYALLAERMTGNREVYPYVTLSVLVRWWGRHP